MALPLPDINGSSGTWGTILNNYLNEMDGRVVAGTNTGSSNATAISNLNSTVGGHTTTINGHTSSITALDNRIDSLEYPTVTYDDDGANQAVSGTAWVGGSPVVGVVFTAPPSGIVLLLWGARLQTDSINCRVHVGFALRTGSTLGSGSTILAPSDQRSIETCQPTTTTTAGINSLFQASRHRVITGLSPYSTYNIRIEHKTSIAGNGQVVYRDIDVIPL